MNELQSSDLSHNQLHKFLTELAQEYIRGTKLRKKSIFEISRVSDVVANVYQARIRWSKKESKSYGNQFIFVDSEYNHYSIETLLFETPECLVNFLLKFSDHSEFFDGSLD